MRTGKLGQARDSKGVPGIEDGQVAPKAKTAVTVL